MQKSLLYYVQQVCSKLDFNNVNSIQDTTESMQIAEEAEVTYYDLMTRDEWPHLVNVITLESSPDSTTPTTLVVPDMVVRVDNIRYDITEQDQPKAWRDLLYLEPADFLEMQSLKNSTETNIQEIPLNSSSILVANDEHPTYWTSFDNKHIVCDSYIELDNATLLGNKFQAIGITFPEFRMEDSFEPDIPVQMVPLYLAELTAASSIYFKQQQSPEDEIRRQRGIARARRTSYTVSGFKHKNNFGRKASRKGYSQAVKPRPYT